MAAIRSEILSTEYITPDVKRFVLTKPKGFRFTSGQGCMVAVDEDGWREKARPFTFTNLPSQRTLELVVKIYASRNGVTQRMSFLRKGDGLLLNEVFGTITYRGPGHFFAGGAGITPFLSIFRQLHKDQKLAGNVLVYSNKTMVDVIMDKELTALLGKNYLKIFTRQGVIGFRERRIDRDALITLVQNFDQYFYLCGPPEFVHDLEELLLGLGVKAESLVFEA
jgi:ferredoxin-NADP reductase